MRDTEWTKVLGWPGYRVYRHEINESAKTLKLWVRRKRGNRKLVCSGCGRKLSEVYDTYEREVRDLPWSECRTTVVVELYRVRCPDCGVKTEKASGMRRSGRHTTSTLLFAVFPSSRNWSEFVRLHETDKSTGNSSSILTDPIPRNPAGESDRNWFRRSCACRSLW